VVLAASPTEVEAVLSDGETVKVAGDGLRFAARSLGDKAAPATRLRRGALIRLARDDKSRWTIAQLPTAEAAFVSMRPRDGAFVSLVGGFDFERNKFNHVTQAQRQPGSSFKPFIYSAALEKGFTPATVVNDAPFFVPADKAGGEDWEPKNYDGKFEGPMRVRTALAKSKNLVTVRVLQAIGPHFAQDYIARFGFDPKLHPPFLTMGLGAGSVTPMQMVAAYAILANGGYRVAPFLIAKVVDGKGNVLSEATPEVAGENAERALDPRNAFLMTSLLKDVIAHGTGARALSLGRRDLAGKTGTTNENVDAWFCGYNAALVGVAWIGHDQPKSLGTNETGGVAALPIWIGYMQKALKGTPEATLPVPDGIVAVRINADTGLRDESGTISEYFLAEFPPRSRDDSLAQPASPGQPGRDIREQLF
jgi:penicillin-binding protein 1A